MSTLAWVLKAPLYSVGFLVLIGLALRLSPLVRDPLHQDEALYGYWGRLVSSGRDPGLATVAVDKPPLVPYLIAGSQVALGVSEFSLRMPALAASLISIPLIYGLARRLYDDHAVAWVAAAVMALTPFPVLFGAAAFTDAVLVVWWLAACWAVSRGNWGWAGLACGLALASKQQALALVPLVVGLGIFYWHRQVKRARCGPALARFSLALIAPIVVILIWDALRTADGLALSFWTQGVDSYGGLRLIRPSELQPRFQGWMGLQSYLLGWSWLGLLCLVGIGVLLLHDLTRRSRTWDALVDLLLAAFGLYYLLLHWFIAFPIWDRYLLPLVPMAGLFLGRVMVLPWQMRLNLARRLKGNAERARLALYALLSATLMGAGLVAANGRVPVGGDHGAYDGFNEVVGYLRKLPAGTVLYERWLSWHYDFYLFDAFVYRAGFPTPEWLATDAQAFYNTQARYLVVPDWESTARLSRALAEVDLALLPVLTTYRHNGTKSFVVYRIASAEGS